jgi:activator of 2-hydroxyglutaryl-CoA dehydratase
MDECGESSFELHILKQMLCAFFCAFGALVVLKQEEYIFNKEDQKNLGRGKAPTQKEQCFLNLG